MEESKSVVGWGPFLYTICIGEGQRLGLQKWYMAVTNI